MSRIMVPWPGWEVDALKGDVKDMVELIGSRIVENR